jgi:hypothetical protein
MLVWVDLSRLFASDVDYPYDGVSDVVRSQGLALCQQVPGVLHAWVRTRQGGWVGMVSYEIDSGHELGVLQMRHLVPRGVVRPRQRPQDREPSY